VLMRRQHPSIRQVGVKETHSPGIPKFGRVRPLHVRHAIREINRVTRCSAHLTSSALWHQVAGSMRTDM